MNNTRIYLMLFIFYVAASAAAAQSSFETIYGPENNIVSSAITTANDSGFIVASSNSLNDICILKFSRQGQLMWQKSYPAPGYESVSNVFNMADGNILIGGNTTSNSHGGLDGMAMLLDSAGNFKWAKVNGDTLNNGVNDFAITYDNGMIGCGVSDYGNNSGWLFKVNHQGTVKWSRSYPGGWEFMAVSPVNDGGYVAAGSDNNYNMYLMKTDMYGIPSWYKQYHTSYQTSGIYDIVTDSAGSIIVTGHLDSITLGYNTKAFLMKTDLNGNIEWFKTYPFIFYSQGNNIIETPDKGFLITGYAADSVGGYAYLLKTDSTGDAVWVNTYGRSFCDAMGIQVSAATDSGFAVAGIYQVTVGSGIDRYGYLLKTDQQGNSCHSVSHAPLQMSPTCVTSDLNITAENFAAGSALNLIDMPFNLNAFDFCTFTGIINNPVQSFNFYPNPATSIITIEGLQFNSDITFYDIAGVQVLTLKALVESTAIDVSP